MTFRLDDSIGFVLNRTNTKLKNGLIQTLKPYGVTPEQWGTLNRLWEQDGISPISIAELTFKDQPTTVRIIEKLEKKRLIFREVNVEDHVGIGWNSADRACHILKPEELCQR